MSLAEHQHDSPKSVAREVQADASPAPPSQSASHDVEGGKNNDTTESSFTPKEKWFLVGLASFAALFR